MSQQYLSHDTIHALASPAGGALAVVRMSGPRAAEILSLLTEKRSEAVPVREVFRTKLVASESVMAGSVTASLRSGEALPSAKPTHVLDDAMAVRFQAPKSHTGEDLVEFFLHGGPAVIERVLETLSLLGSRQALAGEFSFRAVRNGKMSITAAQAVADLISAKNSAAATLALEKMEGSQAKLITDLAEGLRKLATMGELGIDFADQDVEELSLPVLKKRAQKICATLRELEGSFDRGQKIQEGIRAAFIGRPNAGKSSYFNALLGEERSIVSDIAGTTRDVVRENLTLRAQGKTLTLRLEDTAGIRAATGDQIEKVGIERSIRAARDADFIGFVVEAGESAKEWAESLAVWSAVGAPTEKTLVILSKTDRVTEKEIADSRLKLTALGLEKIQTVSVRDGKGIHESAEAIVAFGAPLTARNPGEVLLTRLDHLQAVRDAITHLERAVVAPGEDFFAADLRQALNALGPVIGETLPDDILGRIFSEFCIGK